MAPQKKKAGKKSPNSNPEEWGLPARIELEETSAKMYHGKARQDHYAWLEDRDNPKVKRILQRENEYVDGFFRQHRPTLRRELFVEMRKRRKENETSVPAVDGPFWYYARQVPNAEYPIFCRRPYSREKNINTDFVEKLVQFWREDHFADLPFFDDEEVFLDPNLLLKELRLDALELGEMDVSVDHSKLSVMIDLSNGKEVYTLFVLEMKDVNYRVWLRDHAPPAVMHYCSTKMSPDDSMYNVLDEFGALQSSPLTPLRRGQFGSFTGGKRISKSNSKSSFSNINNCSGVGQEPNGCAKKAERVPKPVPRHLILHRIDQFAMGAEVMWAQDDTLMYLGLDDAMRPYQLVYHDLKTTPDDNPEASLICFEESDEAFWMGSLCTTADRRYFMFETSSSEASEWYVAPMVLRQADALSSERGKWPKDPQTELDGVPLVADSSHAAHGGAPLLDRPTVAMKCVRQRSSLDLREKPVEYDVDHHEQLLGPNEGGWLIRSNQDGHVNFTFWIAPDGEVDLADTFSHWIPFVAYDPMTKLEGVDCAREFLLFSVRYGGTATALFCPISVVWSWWASNKGKAPEDLSLLRWTHFLNISTLLSSLVMADSVSLQENECAVTAFDLWSEMQRPAKDLLTHAFDTPVGVSSPSSPAVLAVPCSNTAHFVSSPVKTSALPFSVEVSLDSSSFECRTCRVSVGHFLRPHELYEMRYELPAEAHGKEAVELKSDLMALQSGMAGSLQLRCLRREVVKGNYKPEDYDGVVVWVPSDYFCDTPQPEGKALPDAHSRPSKLRVPTKEAAKQAEVPVYLLWAKASYHRGQNPIMLHVYGSYGDCLDIEFVSERLSLMDRGFIWAKAAVRGGGEFGTTWRDEGRQLQRGTTVNDFLSTVQFLQDHRLCAPGKLVSCGGSAGGFVVCRAMNAAPQLFHAVIAASPFVDCLSTLLRPDLPLTITEWEEFGNPVESEEAYHLIQSLSPMDTIPPPSPHVFLPHVFLETSWNDTRVSYWESLKLAAHLRAWHVASQQAPSTSLVLHHCNFETGHGGATGRYEQLHELSQEYAFALLVVSDPAFFLGRSSEPYPLDS